MNSPGVFFSQLIRIEYLFAFSAKVLCLATLDFIVAMAAEHMRSACATVLMLSLCSDGNAG